MATIEKETLAELLHIWCDDLGIKVQPDSVKLDGKVASVMLAGKRKYCTLTAKKVRNSVKLTATFSAGKDPATPSSTFSIVVDKCNVDLLAERLKPKHFHKVLALAFVLR